MGQRFKVVAVGVGVAEQRAVVGEAHLHGVADQMQDPGAWQRLADETDQHEVGRQLVHEILAPACPPLGLQQVAPAKQGRLQVAGGCKQVPVQQGVAVAIGGPAQLPGKIIELTCRRHLRMVAHDALQQRRSRARHADDEDGLRAITGSVPVRVQRCRETFDQGIEQRLFGGRVVAQAPMHDAVAALQGVPGAVVPAQVVELFVQREFKRGMVFAAGRRRRQPRLQCIQVIARWRLRAQARQGQRGTAKPGASGQA